MANRKKLRAPRYTSPLRVANALDQLNRIYEKSEDPVQRRVAQAIAEGITWATEVYTCHGTWKYEVKELARVIRDEIADPSCAPSRPGSAPARLARAIRARVWSKDGSPLVCGECGRHEECNCPNRENL